METELPETITYWIETVNNGTGGKTWTVGAKISARIARVSQSKTEKEGKAEIFNDAVYTKTSIPISGYIYIGDADGQASPHSEARRVVDSVSNPTMSTLSKMVI